MGVLKKRYLAIVNVNFADGWKKCQYTIHAIEGTERKQTEIYLDKLGIKKYEIIKVVNQSISDLPSLF